MLKIRLARGGRKNMPYYKIVVADVTSPRDGKFLERIGSYNPVISSENESRVTLEKERAEHWLSVGAVPSERVAKFLIDLGVKGSEKHKPGFVAKKKGDGMKKKAAERAAAAASA